MSAVAIRDRVAGGRTARLLVGVDSGNVELTALFAPKPQAMTAANDWTKAMMTDG